MSILKNAFIKRWAKNKKRNMVDGIQSGMQSRVKESLTSKDADDVIKHWGDQIEADIDRRVKIRTNRAKTKMKNVGRTVGRGALIGGGVAATAAGIGYGGAYLWDKRKKRKEMESPEVQGFLPPPQHHFGSNIHPDNNTVYEQNLQRTRVVTR